MAIEDKTLIFETLKKVFSKISIGILMTKNDREMVYCNNFFFDRLNENLDIHGLINILQNMDGSLNTRIPLNDQDLLIRKEVIMVLDKTFQVYLAIDSDSFRVESSDEKSIKDIIDFTYDGLVVIDKEGKVQMLNRPYADFLGVDQQSSIGRHVTEVIENTRMHIVAQTGKEEVAQLQKINGNYMIATRMPIMKNGEIVGAVGKVL